MFIKCKINILGIILSVLALVSLAACTSSSVLNKITTDRFHSIDAWNDKMPSISFGNSTVKKKKAIITGKFACKEITGKVELSSKVDKKDGASWSVLSGGVNQPSESLQSGDECVKGKNIDFYFFSTEEFFPESIDLIMELVSGKDKKDFSIPIKVKDTH